MGINRNIVECKFERKIEFLNRNASINRNIVECKSSTDSSVLSKRGRY